LLLYTIVTVLALVFAQPPEPAHPEPQEPFNKPQEFTELEPIEPGKLKPIAELKVVKLRPPARVAEATPQAPKGSCEEAIAAVWPANLQSGARLVAQKESSLKADQVGPLRSDGSVGYNYDGSRDYGCFQINDKAHPHFFSGGDWSDPHQNAQYALRIYQERGNWTAWYAVEGILW
jgi:hypothetical protein